MVTIKLVLVLASNSVLNKDDRYGPDRMHQVNTQRVDFTYKRLVRFCCQSEIGERILGLRTCYASPYCQLYWETPKFALLGGEVLKGCGKSN